ncbi:PoNe immunity protein domain-containing protein [Montanilutibacter psychrotolerans]|uniref:DUF1911 domain-containing protein n=1 Tax=Montanilutibacter psychrotolerans TaxID=1327343 RepID=A0A3M8SJA2_9GAMM|nr:PoNe immunity protein domain-containing protein [Lysobacter psychrotolerans]RNF81417.1 DUF1911 domain-containing protein [Lysobacter psychrotolerans]
MTISTVDWPRWFTWKLKGSHFDQRREPHMRYATYESQFSETLNGIAMVTTELPKHVAKARPGGLMTSTRRRLWDTLDWMSMQYSAGAPVEQLIEVWPHAMDWAEEYGRFHEAYHRSDENDTRDITPHATLRDEEYWIVALRLICFGLLSGHGHAIPRVMAFLDYCNEDMGVRDGLLERLVAPFVPGRGTPPDEATRHLPYRKLFKVFDAAPEQRPALMATYLDEWYHASRREPYIDQHGEGDVAFYGYWSWEAAATTFVLGVDDTSYREMAFYPRDWVDHARLLAAHAAGTAPPERVAAGQPAPRNGWWHTPAKTGSRRYFKQGDAFPHIEGSSYGATFWLWSPDQTDPTL